MSPDDAALREQYRTADKLRARMALHQDFSLNPEDFHRWLFERLEAPAGARVLELGCGDGSLWRKNAERVPPGWRVTLVDRSRGMLEAAREVLERFPAEVTFHRADAQDLPLQDASFDLVMANHMLYHVPDVARALAEVRRVLAPGGRFYAATNGVTHMQELHDVVAEQLPGGSEPPSVEGFSLENGGAQLRRVFRSVELHTYPDALEVGAVEPLLVYILSLGRAAPGAKEGLRAALERRLAQGPMRITKATGLFVAS